MSLPEIELDDRGFQELVSEARTRIAQSAPEWTDHNVSDPGITLIELFAWMTEMTTYRLNRVPEKVHVGLLDLLGVRLRPPTAARTMVRFLLSAPPQEPVTIAAGATQVGTARTAYDESTVFEISESRTIAPLAPVAYVLTRTRGPLRGVSVDGGLARPVGEERPMFSALPEPGDAMHLGFDASIARLVLQVTIEAEPARGSGIDPERPPLRWEVGVGPDKWEPARMLDDTTGGFNFGSGAMVVEVPGTSARVSIGGRRAHWLRCSVIEPGEAGGAAYQQSPSVLSITAAPLGAILPAHHAARIDGEVLGVSDGTAAQSFTVLRPPMLEPAEDEWLEVRDAALVRDLGEWHRWDRVRSFSESGEHDRHYVVDAANGTITFGPAVRAQDGTWKQHGAIPPVGAQLRLSRYRHGGGLLGNVAAGTLTVLKEGPPGIVGLTNPEGARGGVDAERLEDVRERGAMELRARHRAVTKEDFEYLALQASGEVARAVCVPPGREGLQAISIRVLPKAHPPERRFGWRELQPERSVLEEVAAHLDEHRLLGAALEVAPVRLVGVNVVVDLETDALADMGRVQRDVLAELYRFVNPLVGGVVGANGTGWEFGRTLNEGELHGVVRTVPGVHHVAKLKMHLVDLKTGKKTKHDPEGSSIALEPDQTFASGKHEVTMKVQGRSKDRSTTVEVAT